MIPDLVRRAADRRPEAPFVIHGDVTWTYGDIESRALRIARFLVDRGIVAGARVVLLMGNSARYVSSYYGILKSGAIAVPLHPGSQARSIVQVLADCEPQAVLTDRDEISWLGALGAGSPSPAVVVASDNSPAPASVPAATSVVSWSVVESHPGAAVAPPAGGDAQRAMIIYTSGSTGRPKGVVLTHTNILENTRSIVSYLGLCGEDRVSVVLPFPYVYGKSLLNTHAQVGGAVVLHDSLLFPNTLLDEMDRRGVTGFAGVPSTFAILLNRSDLARRRFSRLRYVTQAGGAMPVAHIRRLLEALPGCKVYVMYGATEAAARLTYLEPSCLPARIGSVGKPIEGVRVTVRRADGTEADVAEVGELVARGANIMEGYWNDPAATAEVLDEAGFHTGDLGWKDDAGFLWVQGRTREMIKSAAHRIAPREIEEVLLECEVVDEVVVVGVPDELLGEAIVAHLTLRPDAGTGTEAIEAHCRSILPAYKVPRRIEIHACLPRTASGKIDRTALRERLSTG